MKELLEIVLALSLVSGLMLTAAYLTSGMFGGKEKE